MYNICPVKYTVLLREILDETCFFDNDKMVVSPSDVVIVLLFLPVSHCNINDLEMIW